MYTCDLHEFCTINEQHNKGHFTTYRTKNCSTKPKIFNVF